MLGTFTEPAPNLLIFCANMNSKRSVSGILFFLMISSASFSQQVDGHWYGVGVIDAAKDYTNYMSELVLRQKGKIISGTLNYYFKDTLMKVPVNGSYDEQNRRLRIKPFPMIYFLSPSAKNSIDVNMSGEFMLLVSKAESVLSGSLLSDIDHRRTTPPINFRFQRSNDTSDLVMQNEEPEEIKPIVAQKDPVIQNDETNSDFTKRIKVFTKVIEVENSSLRLEIYDNGEIDGDVVALYLNNKKILPSSGLTHRAIRLSIKLDESLEYNELSMFAENLGRIPPNTAALIIYDGATKYETLLTSDLSKSATIKLVKKK
jgi:hypothetical protein